VKEEKRKMNSEQTTLVNKVNSSEVRVQSQFSYDQAENVAIENIKDNKEKGQL